MDALSTPETPAGTETESGIATVVAYNPASGHYRPERVEALAEALKQRGLAVERVPTRPDGIDIPEHARLVCVAGGDGALRQVAHALGDRIAHVPIAVFPSGTVNLIARELGFSHDPHIFADQVAEGWRKSSEDRPATRLARHGGEPVMACLSIGPDSIAVSHFSPALKMRIGRLAYVVVFLKLLKSWPRGRIRMRAILPDGQAKTIEGEAIFLSRSRYYAGPFSLSGRAGLDSESLQLVVMPRASRMGSFLFALAVMAGIEPGKVGLAKTYAVRSVAFDNCSYPVQIDGDHEGACAGEAALTDIVIRFCI